MKAADIGTTIAGSMAQASFDAYVTPRHIGLYAGAPIEAPAHLVQRICGTGLEVIAQAADAVSLGRVDLALGAGTESMSRNPIAAYTHRNGFTMGKVEFKDFLWEALYDPAGCVNMGDTAENLAKQYGISRERVDRFAERSFNRAIAARDAGRSGRGDRAGHQRELRGRRPRQAGYQAAARRRVRRYRQPYPPLAL